MHPTISVEEYDGLMLDHGWEAPFERLGGEVIVVAPIGAETSMTTLALTQRFLDWQRLGPAQGLLLADVPLKLDEHRPVPDLSWWCDARRPPIGKGAVASVPDLVVEVLSPRTRANDLGVKRDIYEHAGVREYWRVDPQDSCVVVGTRIGSELIDLPALTGDDRLTSELLPGFDIVVAELFQTAP